MHKLKRRLAVVAAAVTGALALGTASAASDAEPAGEVIVEARATSHPILAPTLMAEPAQPASSSTSTTSTSSTSSTTSTPSTIASTAASSASATTTSTATTSTAPPSTTTTTTTTTAPPPPESSPVEEAIRRWFPEVYDKAYNVAWCESRLDPRAVSGGGGNHGLFQINTVHRDSFASVTGVSWDEGIYVADHNARFARWLYDDRGWSPWTCA